REVPAGEDGLENCVLCCLALRGIQVVVRLGVHKLATNEVGEVRGDKLLDSDAHSRPPDCGPAGHCARSVLEPSTTIGFERQPRPSEHSGIVAVCDRLCPMMHGGLAPSVQLKIPFGSPRVWVRPPPPAPVSQTVTASL